MNRAAKAAKKAVATESAEARLIVGLVSKKKFSMSVELYGVAVGGEIAPASATTIWTGKPRTQ